MVIILSIVFMIFIILSGITVFGVAYLYKASCVGHRKLL